MTSNKEFRDDAVLSALENELIAANATLKKTPTAENKLAAHHAQQAFDQRKVLLQKQAQERIALEQRKIDASLRTEKQREDDELKERLRARREALQLSISDYRTYAADEFEALTVAFVECERAFLAFLKKRDVDQVAVIDEIKAITYQLGESLDPIERRYSNARDTRHWYPKIRAEIVQRCRAELGAEPVSGDLWGALTKSMRAIAGDGIL